MVSAGLFTKSDIVTVNKAAALAESLTQDYFRLADEWKRAPYFLFTRKHVKPDLLEHGVFAQVVKVLARRAVSVTRAPETYAVVLQDHNILPALLRPAGHDLWTLVLFVLTHELVHIIRFRRFEVDFFAGRAERDHEERIVHDITRDILSGTIDFDHLLSLYQDNNHLKIPSQ
jgi:hypothetical protein